MTIYEVMKDGDVMLVADATHEHVVTWDGKLSLDMYIETEGKFLHLETWKLKEEPFNINMAILMATKMLMNQGDDTIIAETVRPWLAHDYRPA